MAGTLVSVNVGRPRTFEFGGRTIRSAIGKTPVAGRVAARGVNLDGDDQANRKYHGGPEQAVYAYAAEDYRWWEGELARPLGPGLFGENLTIEGLDVNGAIVGEIWEAGTVRLNVVGPRIPCSNLAARMEDPGFVRRFAKAGRPGAYLGIAREGELGAGDAVRVVSRPDHGLTVADVFRIHYDMDRSGLERLLSIPEVSNGWKEWAGTKRRERCADGSR